MHRSAADLGHGRQWERLSMIEIRKGYDGTCLRAVGFLRRRSNLPTVLQILRGMSSRFRGSRNSRPKPLRVWTPPETRDHSFYNTDLAERFRPAAARPLEPAPDDPLAGAFHDAGPDRQAAFPARIVTHPVLAGLPVACDPGPAMTRSTRPLFNCTLIRFIRAFRSALPFRATRSSPRRGLAGASEPRFG